MYHYIHVLTHTFFPALLQVNIILESIPAIIVIAGKIFN